MMGAVLITLMGREPGVRWRMTMGKVPVDPREGTAVQQ